MAVLQALNGPDSGQKFTLPKGRAVLGRGPDCDVVLEAGAVSRQHAQILWIDGEYCVEDLKSRNGTFVNGLEVSGRQKLCDNDRIKICEALFSFHDGMGSSAVLVHDDEESSSTVMSKFEVKSGSGLRSAAVNSETKLKALLEISRNVGSTLSEREVLSKILDSLFKIFAQADRGFVVLREGQNGPLAVKAEKYRRDGAHSARISLTIINQAMQPAHALLSNDASKDFKSSDSIADLNLRSVMCVPLLDTAGKALGVLQIDTLDPRAPFKHDDLDVLASVASLAAVAVENVRLHEMAIKKTRLDNELQLAQDVQRRFLPRHPPRCQGYEFFHFYKAAEQVGGDYFDYIRLPGQRLAVLVADVSGKGVPAALLMAKMSAEARYILVSELEPAAALNRLNADFCGAGWDDRFMTMAVAVIDLERHEAQIVNAGHMAPFLRRANGQVVQVGEDETGLPLGVTADSDYQPFAVKLDPGEHLALFTDGISEAMNADGSLYGLARLERQLGRESGGVRQFGEEILRDVQQFVGQRAQSDDMCLVCFGRALR